MTASSEHTTGTGDRIIRTRDLLGLLRDRPWQVAASALLVITASALGLLQPMVAGQVVETVRLSAPIAGAVLLLVALFIGQVLVDTMGRYLLEYNAEGIVLGLRRRLVDHLLRVTLGALQGQRVGDLLARAGTDTAAVREVATRGLVDLLVGALTVIGATALMLALDPVLFLVVVVVFALAAVAVSSVVGGVRAATEQAQNSVGRFGAELERALTNIRTVRMSRAEEREAEQITALARDAREAGLRTARLTAMAAPAIQLAATGSFLLVLLVGGMRVASGELELGALISVLLYAMYLVIPLGNVLEGMTTMKKATAAYQRVGDVLALPGEQDPPRASPVPRHEPGPGVPVLRFEDVTFGYGDDPALHAVSFVLPTGSRTAIVGVSGAGKSTILSLICRFHDPDQGTIYYRGRSMHELTRRECREHVALVEQHAPAMHGSLYDNLTYAAPHATAEDVARVLRQVNLSGLVERLPDGLDSPVGEHGALLSGGERQRLAIARALLARPDVLLLDEPTSNLDVTNENLVMASLTELPRESAVLMVAHRLSTIREADTVLVLDGGRVTAAGSHEELQVTSEVYRRMLSEQFTIGTMTGTNR